MDNLEDFTAVFLVGGKGTRLGLGDKPKPLVDIDGIPLLERMILNFESQGIKNFIMLCGFGAKKIKTHLSQKKFENINIEIIIEPEPYGTAGCFTLIKDIVSSKFIVVYGDLIFDLDLKKFISYGLNKKCTAVLYAHPNDHPVDSDLIKINLDNEIVDFISKPHINPSCGNLSNAAFYLFDKEIFKYLPEKIEGVLDWGKDIFPKMVAKKEKMFVYRGTEYIKDIGTKDRILKANIDYKKGKVLLRSYKNKQKAIFFDRDGVINDEINGVYHPSELKLRDEAATVLKRVNLSNYLAICVTNQPGIAKGFMSIADLIEIHNKMEWLLAELNGSFFDDIFFCPHHPEKGFKGEIERYKIECECRKPKPGMLLKAAEKHNIDLRSSFLIGDNIRDIKAGESVDVTSFLLGKELSLKEHKVKYISEAIDHILN